MPSAQERESALFALALEKPLTERSAFLQVVCGKDNALRQRLETLLAAHDQPVNLVPTQAETVRLHEDASARQARPTIKLDLADAPEEAVGQTLGRYKLLERVGEGGCGVVYVAEQTEPVRRRVALKVIKLGMDTKQVVARFGAERQALAMMDHPNIAKVLDAGTTEVGRPFFVMELVRGIRITDYCDQANLSTKERLDLFIKVCHAIQHAHQKGIIHRDIKPSNILVTLHDGVPVPKVIDFGIAKATEGRLTDATVYTQLHQFIGTPAYMSPEQAEMSGLDIDTRSDIYSLGVLLYELLAGSTPFDPRELMASGIDAMRKTIREKEPQRPSTRLATLGADQLTTTAKRRSVDTSKLVHQLKGDLDWIVMMCLEKDRTRRYDTANGLAADLKRHLAHEPVTARPPTLAYACQKAWRRNRLLFTAGAIVAASLVVGIGVSSWQAVVANKARSAEKEQRLAAQAERNRAEINGRELLQNLYAVDIKMAYQALQENKFGVARDLIRKYLPALRDSGLASTSSIPASGHPEQRNATVPTRDLLGWEWRYLWQLCRGDEKFTLTRYERGVNCGVFSPNGRLLATSSDRIVRVTELQSRQVVATLGGPDYFNDILDQRAVAFSEDGKYLAVKGGTAVVIWEVGKWEAPYKRLEGAPNYNYNNSAIFSPDGGRFATRVSGGVGFWDTTTWEMRLVPGSPGLGTVMKYSPDGKTLVTSDWNQLEIRDAHTLDVLTNLFLDAGTNSRILARVLSVDFSTKFLAAGYRNGEVKLWETGTWREAGGFKAHPSYVFGLAFSPDGKTLVSGGTDQVLLVWDVASITAQPSSPGPPKAIKKLKGHLATVLALAFSPDGHRLVSASEDRTVKLWDTVWNEESNELANGEYPLRFSQDGKQLLTKNGDERLHLWNTERQTDLGVIGPAVGGVRQQHLVISDDGRTLALRRADGMIEVWNLQTDQREHVLQTGEASGQGLRLAFSHDARLLAEASPQLAETGWQGTIRIWNTKSGTAPEQVIENGFGPMTFSSDGGRLISCRPGGSIVVTDLKSGRSLADFKAHPAWPGCVALSPDDRLLATAAEDDVSRIWDMASGKELYALQGNRTTVAGLAFSPDGKTLVTQTWDGESRFWNVATGKELFSIEQPIGGWWTLLSPNGEYVAFKVDGGVQGGSRVALWRAPSWEEIAAAEAKEKAETK